MSLNKQHTSSFRDPSGYVFLDNAIYKRHINPVYFKQFNALSDSGFFKKLFANGLLINHRVLTEGPEAIVIEPEQIPFITYPYEWSFNQYKEAALLTLKLQKYCLEHGFSLKDSSAFNVTFHKGKAVFIDTLSFDFYQENMPWRAYKQFIEHFLTPLVLAHYNGANALKLMTNFMDGIPIKMVASMLPFKTKLNPFLYSNIHLLAAFEDKHNKDYTGKTKVKSLSKKAQLNIIESLYNYIKKLNLKGTTEWGDYYDKTNYTDKAFLEKSEIINTWLSKLTAKTVIDVGGNNGEFVRKIRDTLDLALVCDIDNNAVDANYKALKENKETFMLPFVLDVLNPSAAIGFNNAERLSFIERITTFSPDVTLALAVIHHMSLSGNITFDMSAKFFARFSKYLVIEFPKREDSWVERLLNAKAEFKDHFKDYSLTNFETIYKRYFDLVETHHIDDSQRVMYLFKIKDDLEI